MYKQFHNFYKTWKTGKEGYSDESHWLRRPETKIESSFKKKATASQIEIYFNSTIAKTILLHNFVCMHVWILLEIECLRWRQNPFENNILVGLVVKCCGATVARNVRDVVMLNARHAAGLPHKCWICIVSYRNLNVGSKIHWLHVENVKEKHIWKPSQNCI